MIRKPSVKTSFVCSSCAQTYPKWAGQCASCGAWNSISEQATVPTARGQVVAATSIELARLDSRPSVRLLSNIAEVDRVFGGGIVGGSVSLIAGDPGIGKSTLLLRLSDSIARAGNRVLYVCGEESSDQVQLRAKRLSIGGDGLFLLATSRLEVVIAELNAARPALVVVDSIQTLATTLLDAVAGTTSQIQACTQALTDYAKSNSVPVIMTGHVTKEGVIAGPRLLEHAVDVVLYLEGDANSGLRLLRGVKNRFGATDEIGVFEMRADGMMEVPDPSRVFLSSRRPSIPGSVLATVIEGTRPFTVEVQALTSHSSFPVPRRQASGIDPTRLALVSAVLSRRVGVGLQSQDIIVNVPGGLRVREPAIDLSIALAIVSSLTDRPVREGVTTAAEVGLGGELRPVAQTGRRVTEAARLGLRHCLVASSAEVQASGAYGVSSLAEAIEFAIGAGQASQLDPPQLR
ncbi:MAG: DNA repair protein RadA [SAR202 cluster bacterium]|nr:DNA repair protein RadA [SAR202 cluster bacterium]